MSLSTLEETHRVIAMLNAKTSELEENSHTLKEEVGIHEERLKKLKREDVVDLTHLKDIKGMIRFAQNRLDEGYQHLGYLKKRLLEEDEKLKIAQAQERLNAKKLVPFPSVGPTP